MPTPNCFLLSAVLASLLGASAAQESKPTQDSKATDPWLTDLAAAHALAKQKGLDVLLEFTGTDWCHWCRRLRSEVLDTKPFLEFAQKHFVLVTLDYPRRTKLPPALERQNHELQAKFDITAFPTLLLTDADGRPYAQTGHIKGGPEPYLKHLTRLLQKKTRRDAAMAKAGLRQGPERAVALSSVLDAIDTPLRRHYGAIMDEILALDASNVLGLKAQVEKERAETALSEQVAALETRLEGMLGQQQFQEAVAAIERFCTEKNPKGASLQRLLVCECAARAGLEDFAGAATTAKAALAAAPEGEMADQLRKRIGELARIVGDKAASRKSAAGK